MNSRCWYEVRVRECIVPGRFINGRWIDGKYVKKSKFYLSKDSQGAAGKYKGKGSIMWVEKVGREKLLGIGDFFRLGDTLLKELSQEVGLPEQREDIKEQRRTRRSFQENFRRG